NPKSTEPAVSACCNRASPGKDTISSRTPFAGQTPPLTPISRPAKGNELVIALPTRAVTGCCAAAPDSAAGDVKRAATAPTVKNLRLSTSAIAALLGFRTTAQCASLKIPFDESSRQWNPVVG